MKIKLTWAKTNDYLLFDVINQEVAKWFIETSQARGNNYATADTITDIPRRSADTNRLIEEISNDVDAVNKFLISMKQTPFTKPTNWCDQTQLNKLHKDWATSRKETPTLSNFLYKLDKKIFDSYQEMNCHIHLIERSFYYSFRDETHWRVENIFKDQPYDWQVANLTISYPGHGRSAFEKFENFDEELATIELDNCNWDNIDAYVKVNLFRPYKLTPPTEFLEWCKDKNLLPHTYDMPLANLCDWQNTLTKAREMFMKNVKIQDNYFNLEMVE